MRAVRSWGRPGTGGDKASDTGDGIADGAKKLGSALNPFDRRGGKTCTRRAAGRQGAAQPGRRGLPAPG